MKSTQNEAKELLDKQISTDSLTEMNDQISTRMNDFVTTKFEAPIKNFANDFSLKAVYEPVSEPLV